jgi:hypothetical protein
MKTTISQDRKTRGALIRLASTLEKGSPERRRLIQAFVSGKYDEKTLEKTLENAGRLSGVDPSIAEFLVETGLRDGDVGDDKIPMGKANVSAGKLKPSQTTMTLDKTLGMAVAMLLDNMPTGGDLGAIISKDNHILDGHHRWSASIAAGGPGISVGGYKADLLGKDLLKVLNVVTKGRFKGRNGNPGKGDIKKYTPANVKKALEKGLKDGLPGKFPISPADVAKALEKLGGTAEKGIEQMAANLGKMSKAVPGWAPARKDMPVIDADEISGVSKILNKGDVNWNKPLALSEGRKGALIRLAAVLPKGSPERRVILAGLKSSRTRKIAHVYVASRSKTAASMAKHIRALQRMFPKSMVQTTEEGGWGSGGIWTAFGEEGVSNYQRAGWPDEHHPKLAAYMDKHGLFGEWNDPGTLMIYHR